jgi:hypothetical protein
VRQYIFRRALPDTGLAFTKLPQPQNVRRSDRQARREDLTMTQRWGSLLVAIGALGLAQLGARAWDRG